MTKRGRKKASNRLDDVLVNRFGGIDLKPGGSSFEESYNAFMRHHNLQNTREATIQWYRVLLNHFRRFLESRDYPQAPLEITGEHIEEYILYCKEKGNKVPSLNGKIRCLRIFFSFLCGKKMIPENPVVLDPIKDTSRVIPTFTQEQLKLLFEQPDLKSFCGVRDYTIMLLLIDTGVRIGEVINAYVEDIIREGKQPAGIVIKKPKSYSQRILPLSPKMVATLENYLHVRGEVFKYRNVDWLFPSLDFGQLKKRTIQERISKYGLKAGIKDVRVSPHTFRHTFAKMWVMEGGDVFSLQEVLGHSTLEMVRKYARLFSRDVQEKHKKFSPVQTQNL